MTKERRIGKKKVSLRSSDDGTHISASEGDFLRIFLNTVNSHILNFW